MKPWKMTEVVDGKRYSTDTATLLAGDDWWDGHNFERSGRNCFLYRTPKGAYFEVVQSQWVGERATLRPMTPDEALRLYASMPEKRVDIADAFPGLEIPDA